jgi:AcrR family transcriptional regulator
MVDAGREPLTRSRVLREAVALADEGGLAGLTMRRLGQRLGVEAMSLYNHVANKDTLLDGMADLVSEDFAVPTPGADWREALRRSALSAHDVLLRHPWAATLLESRSNPGPARLRYLDGVVGTLVEAGFPIRLAYLTFMTLDSYVYGFTLQEVSAPAPPEQEVEAAEAFVAGLPDGAYPHLVAMAEVVMDPGHDRGADFGEGLDLILDAVQVRWAALDGLTS